MSFVLTTPEMVTTAAQDLVAIQSTLGQASASAAGSTTAVVAAAEDEISTVIAALFRTFGQEYQAVNTQAQAFHEQFVSLLSGGANAYLSTEAANAEQTLLSAVNAPARALLGQPLTGTGAGAAEFVAAAATSSAIPASYQNLLANTTASLQGIGSTWANSTVPALLHAVTGYPQLISTSLQNGDLLPILGIPARLAQGSTALYQALNAPVSLSSASLSSSGLSLGFAIGLPQLLAIDALGAPVNAAFAAGASGTAALGALQAGNTMAAVNALVDAPANITNGFLNGQQTLAVRLFVPGLSVTADIPFSGLLAPLQPLTATASVPILPQFNTLTISGPPIGGLVPALVEYIPQLLVTTLGP
ncbi:PE family protein [Mycobacterium basiliense]|nr:PE family protein [Mycobacterium basiliense]